MRRTWQLYALVGALAGALLAMVAGSAALLLLGTGIPGEALSPWTLTVLVGVLGVAMFLLRPDALGMRIGKVLFANGLGFAVGSLAAGALDYGTVHPIPRLAAQAAYAAMWATELNIALWALFILLLPDGRFASRGWKRFFVAGTVVLAAYSVVGWLGGSTDAALSFFGGTPVPQGVGGPFAGALGSLSNMPAPLAFPLLALLAPVQRYRRGGAVVREQLRWFLAAMSIEVIGQITGSALFGLGGAPHDAGVAVSVLTQPLPAIAGTLVVLRYRLWAIDLVVSRALVYGVLWAVLSALLLVPALAAGLLVGGRGALAAVAIALLVVVVFQPARGRLERVAEALVYRHRKPPHVLLTGFWETLRTADLERFGPLLAHAVHGGLGVEWAGAWVYVDAARGRSLRPLGLSGAPETSSLLVSEAAAAQLRSSPGLVLAEAPAAELEPLWPATPAAVVPLVAGDELVGLLACGPRRGDALGAADFELLELLGREAALRLRNLRLESQLRDRLELIEAQAEELRLSRQRLVSAQDEERRRIERDLHDGVQQQLVSLGVRLQRLAHGADNGSGPLLADLAAEAEQAVFALQELGRGIFPSVLADQGLTAALRTQATRVPLAVRVEAEDGVVGRRFEPEVEAALYFVGLEALTNAQKHAPGAAVLIHLRGGEGEVALEVVDDGPGLDGRGRDGTGLQNMADRIAAVGGSLAIEDAPEGGTRVRAAVPVWAAAQAPAADSRR